MNKIYLSSQITRLQLGHSYNQAEGHHQNRHSCATASACMRPFVRRTLAFSHDKSLCLPWTSPPEYFYRICRGSSGGSGSSKDSGTSTFRPMFYHRRNGSLRALLLGCWCCCFWRKQCNPSWMQYFSVLAPQVAAQGTYLLSLLSKSQFWW